MTLTWNRLTDGVDKASCEPINNIADYINETGENGLGNLDNTSDADKPISTAQQETLDTKLNKAGDTMSGNLEFESGNGLLFPYGNSESKIIQSENTLSISASYGGSDAVELDIQNAGSLDERLTLKADGSTYKIYGEHNTHTQSADTIVDGTTNKVFTATEQTKLGAIAENANNYTHPTTAGNKHLPTGGTVGQVILNSASGTGVWGNETNTKVSRFVVGTSTAGWTSADCDYLCDGTADQTEINAAITALPATGGKIVILDGTYSISAKITVNKSNVSLRGNGNATILKRNWNSGSSEGVINVESGVSYFRIEDLFVNGQKSIFTSANNHGIKMVGAENNIVSGNQIINNGGNGILTWPAIRGMFTNNVLENNGVNGMLIRQSAEALIMGNSSNNNIGSGIFIQESPDSKVIGNSCIGNSADGIHMQTEKNSTVTGNSCNSNSIGISSASGGNNTITGNACIRGTGLATDYTASQHTIRLESGGNSYNLISSNNCMGKAVTNEGGTGNTLVNNKFDAT